MRYPIIASALNEEASKNYISSIFKGVGLDYTYLDRLLSYLTEIKYVLNKLNKHKDDNEEEVKDDNVEDSKCKKVSIVIDELD